MGDLYLIYKNLTRKPLRLFLTAFAIFIAFLIFSSVTTLKAAMDAGIEMSADNRLVVVNSINFTNPLPISYVNKVKSVEGVDKVTHANWFGGYFKEPANQIVTFAVDPSSYLDVMDEIVVDPAQKAAWLGNRQSILVGASVAKAQGWKVGDRVPVSSNIFSRRDGGHTWDFVIAGIFTGRDAQTDTNYQLIHYKYFNETQSFSMGEEDRIGWIVLTTADPSINESVAKTIDDMFANSSAETDTSTEKAFNKAFVEQIGNIGLILFWVVFMAFFTILLVVGNTMVLAVRERSNEIALFKTLGFSATRIFGQVLGESLLLSMVGGLAGLAAAYGVVAVLREQMARFLPNLILTDSIALQAIACMLTLGLVTGIIPAVSAYRLNIIRALSRR